MSLNPASRLFALSINNALSDLGVPESIEKIFEIDHHICCAASGVITDARSLIEHARV